MTKEKKKRGLIIGGLIAGAGLIALLWGTSAKAEPGDDPKPRTSPIDPLPTDPDVPRLISIAICQCWNGGIDPTTLQGYGQMMRCVAESVWPDVQWPPTPEDHQTMHDAWQMIRNHVTAFRQRAQSGDAQKWCDDVIPPGTVVDDDDDDDVDPIIKKFSKKVKPKPRRKPTGKRVVKVFPRVKPDPDAPKPNIVDIIKTYPTPGAFYQVEYGDIFLGELSGKSIVYRALLTAGFLAAKEIGGLSTSEANAFAKSIAKQAVNRLHYLQMIQCGWWNAATYTTYGYGPKAWPNAAGMAIRMMPYSAPVRAQIEDGTAPYRNIRIGDESDRGKGNAGRINGQWSETEFLWLPPLDLKALWNDGIIALDETPWPGVPADSARASRIAPPPEVTALGIYGVPDGSVWGCAGYPQVVIEGG